MTVLSAVRRVDEPAGQRAAERLRASLAAQGFPGPVEFRIGAGLLLWHGTPGNPASAELCTAMPDGAIACAGTLFYRGKGGAEALRRLWNDFDGPSALDSDSLFGSYVLAVAKDGRLWLASDRIGMGKLYAVAQLGAFSNSWLACAEALDRPRLDRIGALDYLLSGANHGERTPLADVRIVDPACAVELGSDERRVVTAPDAWLHAPSASSPQGAVEHCAELLVDRFRVIGTAFEGRLKSALSGGFDSRLILAASRAAGHVPALHVYGRADDPDPAIARAVAGAIGLPLRHVDKAAAQAALPPLSDETLADQARFFDGIPNDGILDRGIDMRTRIEQSAGGAVALNGGGGEILRNFFYLRDRGYSVDEMFQAFYGNHPPSMFAKPGDLAAYRDYMVAAIGHQLGTAGRLSREQVELVYPLFRCRFWAGRNNSIAARCGHFLTPLLDAELVRYAARLPIAWKDYGRFESSLIARLDPAVAAIPTDYGFAPADGPDRRYRLKMWLQNRRPPWLRARTRRIRELLGKARPVAPRDEIRQLIPGPLAEAEILRVDSLFDDGQLDRALTLEYLIRSRGISLS